MFCEAKMRQPQPLSFAHVPRGNPPDPALAARYPQRTRRVCGLFAAAPWMNGLTANPLTILLTLATVAAAPAPLRFPLARNY